MRTTTPAMAPENHELYVEEGLLRQLAGAFSEGSLESLNAELHGLCGALASSAPGQAERIDSLLAERVRRESLEASSVAAQASFD